ncbi:MAG TPA: GIY-YIG nuclease family protein [Caulobacteraceae bacterium]
MFYVYLLSSIADPAQRYVGFTADLKRRVKSHNKGASVHTSKYKPWKLVTYLAFDNERRAREFEHYLKSGSGRTFANKRLWPGATQAPHGMSAGANAAG